MVSQPDVTSDARFAAGLNLYTSGRYFECHEVWEDLWRECAPRDRLFVQALIHLAVAFYQHERVNPDGAPFQPAKCLRKLAGYLPVYAGIDTRRLSTAVERAQERMKQGNPVNPIPIY